MKGKEVVDWCEVGVASILNETWHPHLFYFCDEVRLGCKFPCIELLMSMR